MKQHTPGLALAALTFLLVAVACSRPASEQASAERSSEDTPTTGDPDMSRFEEEDAVMPYDPYDEPEADSQALRIKEKHEARLLAIDGVEGVGLGTDEIGEAAIVLYLRDAGMREQVPATIEGVPVVTEVTGVIDAY